MEVERNKNLMENYSMKDLKAQKYINDLTLSLELDGLYKLVGSCN